MTGIIINIDLKGSIEQAVRDVLILDIGQLWDDYCFENNINGEVKMEAIGFLEDFAKKLNNEYSR